MWLLYFIPLRCLVRLSVCFWALGPEFGSPPSFMRKKLLKILSECGKVSSFIDDVSVVKRYASGSCHAFPVSSDDEVLSKAKKEVVFTFCMLFGNQ